MNIKHNGFASKYIREVCEITKRLDLYSIEKVARILSETRKSSGRLFIIGIGGSAANASHAVNDFRKIAGFEAYAPTDNTAELTAHTNDVGWDSVFESWLKTSRLRPNDALLIFSVSGGNPTKRMSLNLVKAIKYAKRTGSKTLSVVGDPKGYAAQHVDESIVIPIVNPENVTPHSEAFQGIIWHLLVSHPLLNVNPNRWETRIKPATL
ncbi:MAG: SIS domain-containing protein [Candidatus Micrarchaeota archaeon]|nr:SIS domain-containing protein [Candidatus Micrarchaeota archaeon]